MPESTIHVAVSIMAHPARSKPAHALANRLKTFESRIVFDPDPGGVRSTIRTAREAWVPWSTHATHHLVLQDDVVLHPDFESQVTDALTAQPDAIISFFSEWGSFTSHALRVAAVAGRAFVTQPDTYLGTQAIAMRTEYASAFAKYLENVDLEMPDDHAIWKWAHATGKPHLVTNPNLVDHDISASLAGNQFQGVRRSTVYVPSECLSPTWWRTEPLTSLIRLPSQHWLFVEPVSYVREDGPDSQWSMHPRVAVWEASEADLHSLIDEVVDEMCTDRADGEIRETVRGLTNILADILVLGTALRAEDHHTVGRVIELAAVESMAPGCLRRLVTESPESLNLERGREALVKFVAEARPMIDASPSLPIVRSMHVGTPQSA